MKITALPAGRNLKRLSADSIQRPPFENREEWGGLSYDGPSIERAGQHAGLCRTMRCANTFGKSNRMGKGRKKRRKHNNENQGTREELDLIKEKVLERFEGGRAERERAQRERAEHADVVSFLANEGRDAPARAGGDPPPIRGETDPLVRSPLKPKPHLRSGAIALPEPEPVHAFLTAHPKLVSK